MIAAVRPGYTSSPRTLRRLLALSIALAAALTAGCGGKQRPLIGPIQFTDASGASVTAVSSLAVNGQVYLVATVTHDDQFLGVSWIATCGSAASPGTGAVDTSCGTFSPSQTLSGPVPAYPQTGVIATYTAPAAIPKGKSVTITAHATSLPSVTSGVVLTIVAAKTTETKQPGPLPAEIGKSIAAGPGAQSDSPAPGDLNRSGRRVDR